MSDRDRLIRAIVSQPDEDTPRLAYADWLDEFGEPERAEFIRVQIELAAVQRAAKEAGAQPHLQGYAGRVTVLARREGQLLDLAAMHNWVEFPAVWNITDWWHTRGFVSEVRCDMVTLLGGACGRCGGGGTIEQYEGALPDAPCPRCKGTGRTEGIAADLFARHPVTSVVVTDKRPSEWSAGVEGEQREWVWERSMGDQDGALEWSYLGAGPFDAGGDPEVSVLPGEVFDIMAGVSGGYYFVIGKDSHKRYDTEADANAALSAAIVAVCRELAELPPLPDTSNVGGAK